MASLSDKFEDFREKISFHLQPLNRSFQFWARAADIYTSYKVCQMKVKFVEDVEKQDAMWEKQHEVGAEKMYSLCSELGGLFLKAAQILGKPDLAPAAWVKRLVTLCDQAPATPFPVVRKILEEELGNTFEDIFERFDTDPVGSASIAQVHRARLKSAKMDVAVKVQHPCVEHLMMVDIKNLQKFVLFLQKTDIQFDLFSVTKEIEKQIGYEFDFMREAAAMERIRKFFHANNKTVPVLVPQAIQGMTTRKVLVMEFMEGVPIMKLGDEIARRGIDPGSKLAAKAKKEILRRLSLAYGQMILKDGFFHADPHPGNILVGKGSEVALLDYGQVKHLPDNLRLGYANLVVALANNDQQKVIQSYRELGIDTRCSCDDEERELFKLAQRMFDTQLPPGVTLMSPFSDDSSLKKIGVQNFPEELFSVLRTMQLLRGLSVGLGINYSCAEQWKPIAEEILYKAGKLKEEDLNAQKPSILRRLFGRKLKLSLQCRVNI